MTGVQTCALPISEQGGFARFGEERKRREGLRPFGQQQVLQVTRKRGKNIRSSFDPNGSYTGVPADGGKPVQDADDL